MGRLRVVFAALLLALLAPGAAAAYSWPFKPFNRQHPIRGFFGDPRTVYYNGILATPFVGTGIFSFHQGVDIVARDGTPIYAVADGTAHYLGSATLNLITKGGVTFQYFHIVSVVGEEQPVRAGKTVLGYVQPPFGHVHITEINDGKAVNPLQVTADFRKTLPPNSTFFNVYAHGTYENAPRFGREQYASMPGRYLFLLAASYDTTTIPNGVYTITVQAADERGNSTFAARRISVLNAHGGQCPGSLPLPPGAPPPPEPPR